LLAWFVFSNQSKISDGSWNAFIAGAYGAERIHARSLFGLNVIEINVRPYYVLFVEEILDPFFVFQAFAIILWFYQAYTIYAGALPYALVFHLRLSIESFRRLLDQFDTSILAIFSGF
jgi:hypothetical protein